MRVFKNKMFYKWSNLEDLEDTILFEAANEIESGLIDAYLGGDLIKKRIARKGQGKRDGFRTLVAFRKKHRVIYVYGFPKNQRDNINDQEEKALKKLAQNLLNARDENLQEMIAKGDLFEVCND